MGIPYETFLIIFIVGQAMFGAMTQADRRAGSLYGRAFAAEGTGRFLRLLNMLGQLAWPALLIIGFLSLRWYLVIAIFFVAGSIGGIVYTFATVRRGSDQGAIHNFAAGIAGMFVAALTVFLWVQRLMH